MTQPKPAPSVPLPDIPECQVARDDAGAYHLTHTSGRTATAHSERGAMLCGMALRILAEHADPPPPGMRHTHIEWPRGLEDEIHFRTGDLQ